MFQILIIIYKYIYSVAALRMSEIFEKCEIAKLKVAVTNIFNMKNNFINMENLFLSELDVTK